MVIELCWRLEAAGENWKLFLGDGFRNAKRKVVDFSEQVTLASVVSALVRGAQTAVASLIGYAQGFFSTKESTDFDADTYSGI